MIKNKLNDVILIAASLVNMFSIGNTLFNAWSLIWPKVPGQVISEEIKIQGGALGRSTYKQYLLCIAYEYSYAGLSYSQKRLIDVFDSKQICEAAKASYQNKAVTVYVNPVDPKFSVIAPVNGLINSLISTGLTVILTMFLLYILMRRSNFSEGLALPVSPQW
jgi:hypothetical protein